MAKNSYRNRTSQIEQELMENIYNKKPESEILAEINSIIPDELKPTDICTCSRNMCKDDVMHKDEDGFFEKKFQNFLIDNETVNSLKKSVDVAILLRHLKIKTIYNWKYSLPIDPDLNRNHYLHHKGFLLYQIYF